MITAWILFPVFSYLLGAVPFGHIISRKIADIDITRKGSGNIGATNVSRELGIKWGLLTLLFDLLKGFLPLFIVINSVSKESSFLLIAVSIAVLIGHRFSPFLKFRGGKGVAAAFGIFLALSPLSAFTALIVFLITVYFSDYISLGSIAAAFSMPVILSLLGKPAAPVVTAFFAACIILLTHRENIIRIITGHERRWKDRKSGKNLK